MTEPGLDWSRIRYFKPGEFACRCGCGANRMDLETVYKLDALRERLRTAIVVTSGYRCPAHNAATPGAASDSAHVAGKAADLFVIGGVAAFPIVAAAIDLGFTGIGIDQKRGGRRIVHLDTLDGPNRPAIWSY